MFFTGDSPVQRLRIPHPSWNIYFRCNILTFACSKLGIANGEKSFLSPLNSNSQIPSCTVEIGCNVAVCPREVDDYMRINLIADKILLSRGFDMVTLHTVSSAGYLNSTLPIILLSLVRQKYAFLLTDCDRNRQREREILAKSGEISNLFWLSGFLDLATLNHVRR